MRHSYALLVGTLRRTGVRLVRPARQGVTRNAGGEARGGLPEGASEQQTNAPRISCPSRLSLFPARQGGPGASGVRHRKGRIPGVDSVHGSFDQQSETVMKLRTLVQASAAAVIALILTGCAAQPYDYTNYRQHPPRSIVVLPPLNESTAVEATYGYLSTVTRPIAEQGYYVFPVAVVDQFLKENGLPVPVRCIRHRSRKSVRCSAPTRSCSSPWRSMEPSSR